MAYAKLNLSKLYILCMDKSQTTNLQNLSILHQHIRPGYSELVKGKETIISCLESHLWSNFSHFDPWKRHVGVCISDLDKEGMDSVAYSFGV